jgi:hypothetical protein
MSYLTDVYSLAILLSVVGIAAALAVGIYYFVNEKKFDQLRKWTTVIVNGLEQTMKLVPGPRKFELAMIALRGVRDGLHAKATDQELSMLIEGAVHVMKTVANVTPGTLDDELVGSLTSGLSPSEAE